jgi:hypothetical protein
MGQAITPAWQQGRMPRVAGSRLLRGVREDARDLLLDLSAAALRAFDGLVPVVLSKSLIDHKLLAALAALEFVGGHASLLDWAAEYRKATEALDFAELRRQ